MQWHVSGSFKSYSRSSHRKRSVNKIALWNFVHFTGKQFCWSLFLIKLQVFRPATLIKRDSKTVSFPVKFAKFFRTPLLKNIYELMIQVILIKSSEVFWYFPGVLKETNGMKWVNPFQPISSQCFISEPPEKMRQVSIDLENCS